MHQSFMRFLWLDWRKSTLYPVTAPNDSKCWPIVTLSIQELVVSNCDVTMTDCSRVVAMEAFVAQWCWGQRFYFVNPVFQSGLCQYIWINWFVSFCMSWNKERTSTSISVAHINWSFNLTFLRTTLCFFIGILRFLMIWIQNCRPQIT